MNLPKIEVKVTLTPGEKYKVTNSEEAYDILKDLFSKDTISFTEEMILLAFNRQNEVYGWYRLSAGGTAGTVCDKKVIFSILLNATAHSFMLAHNHPSGTLTPSRQDIQITQELIDAARILDMEMLDHIIITQDSYRSLRDNNDARF